MNTLYTALERLATLTADKAELQRALAELLHQSEQTEEPPDNLLKAEDAARALLLRLGGPQ